MEKHAPYIKAINLAGFEQSVSKCGLSATELLKEAGIPIEALRNPEMVIDFKAYCRVYALTTAKTGQNILTVFRDVRFPNVGAFEVLLRVVPNLAAWVELALKYWEVQTNSGRFESHLDPSTNDLVISGYIHPDCLPASEIVEGSALNMMNLARYITGKPDLKPCLVTFQHAPPVDAVAYDSFFGVKVLWRQSRNAITLSKHDVDAKLGGRWNLLRPAMDIYVRYRRHLAPDKDRNMTSRVSLVIPALLGTGQCKAETVADAIGLKLKTMQRRLVDEGTTFSEILESVRQSLAKHYLEQTRLPVEHVARLLDYSTTAPFTVAFERWTGETPLKFRNDRA